MFAILSAVSMLKCDPHEEFDCGEGKPCLPLDRVCDHNNDCGTGKMNQRTAARKMSAKKTMEDVILFVLTLQEDFSLAVRRGFSCLET